MFAKEPQKTYRLGESLPPIPIPFASWPWRGSPALTKWSLDMLHYPLGTIIADVVDGHPVIAQIQTHSYYGAHPDWPATPHKGTSVYVPTALDASGKKVAVADPPDGWGESTTGVGSPMESIVRNGRPVSFGVGERFCPSLPYVCPPRPWGPDPGPQASIADRLGTGAPPTATERALAAHRARTVATRERAAERARIVRANETARARAWRPAWGVRPPGFGVARWRLEWGARPAWFGARQWRGEWGTQPAWWGAHITAQQEEVPEPPAPADGAPADSSAPAGGSPSAASTDGSAPASDAIQPDASAPIAGDKPGLSTAAKVGIGIAAVAVVGGGVAAVVASRKKRTP